MAFDANMKKINSSVLREKVNNRKNGDEAKKAMIQPIYKGGV